jgi:hypothetical protein
MNKSMLPSPNPLASSPSAQQQISDAVVAGPICELITDQPHSRHDGSRLDELAEAGRSAAAVGPGELPQCTETGG